MLRNASKLILATAVAAFALGGAAVAVAVDGQPAGALALELHDGAWRLGHRAPASGPAPR